MKNLIILLLTLSVFACVPAKANVTLHLDNGIIVNVPQGWSVQVVPEGFNSAPYDEETNILGKLPGFGGWPLLEPLCRLFGYFEPVYGTKDPQWYTCNLKPELLTPATPEYDFYDSDSDGVIDFGDDTGCSYDPFSYPLGRELICP